MDIFFYIILEHWMKVKKLNFKKTKTFMVRILLETKNFIVFAVEKCGDIVDNRNR